MAFVSRAGEKLAFALKEFSLDVHDLTCADFGCSTGGFTDCLLQNGAAKVYAVDTAYGELAWKLRQDKHVVVMERTNAMHVMLPEKMDLITNDTSWTKQKFILPNIKVNLKEQGKIITLIKPHYEVDQSQLTYGVLPKEKASVVAQQTLAYIQEELGLKVINWCTSPILGKGGNTEFLALLRI